MGRDDSMKDGDALARKGPWQDGWVPAEWPQQGPVTLEAVVGEQIKKPLLVFRSDSQRQCDLLALFFLEIGKLRLGNSKQIP